MHLHNRASTMASVDINPVPMCLGLPTYFLQPYLLVNLDWVGINLEVGKFPLPR